ncbi:MAG: hypothetical protein OQJ97_15485 [Rhodospirillales bacterium]|nr:hypothetical protein [Rhodospirillales bacterium]
MMKISTISIAIIVFVILIITLAGMYKFNYLSEQPGYDVDGNKIKASKIHEVCDENLKRYPSEQEALDAGLDYPQFGATYCPDYKMHPSWDVDKDGLNDCEKDGTCDNSVDYMSPR